MMQRIVVFQNGRESLLERLNIYWLLHFEQHCLIKMLGIGNLLLKEPPLDWRQRDNSGDHTLFDGSGGSFA